MMKVILFFTDWGMDHHQYGHLQGGDYDVIIISNYSDYSIYNTIKTYRQINIIAQGAGVWAASAAFDNIYHTLSTSGSSTYGSSTSGKYRLIRLLKKMGKAIAIDGTLCPVSNIWGIPQEIFNIMAEGPGEMSRELRAFRENYLFSNAILWNKAIICKNNPIIPAENQTRFWNEYNLGTDRNHRLTRSSGEFSITYMEKSHFPFEEYEKWDSILNL
jgi:hypothetical protein